MVFGDGSAATACQQSVGTCTVCLQPILPQQNRWKRTCQHHECGTAMERAQRALKNSSAEAIHTQKHKTNKQKALHVMIFYLKHVCLKASFKFIPMGPNLVNIYPNGSKFGEQFSKIGSHLVTFS